LIAKKQTTLTQTLVSLTSFCNKSCFVNYKRNQLIKIEIHSTAQMLYCFEYILAYFFFPGAIVMVATVVGAIVIVPTVVGAIVIVPTVVGAIVIVATVVGAAVVGAAVVGAAVVGAAVVGAAVVGAAVVGAGVIGDGVGAEVGGWQKFTQSCLASALQV